ncbi:aspartyl protease 25-like [Cryptomeria japonica]|uniref:aspartyl protease 25-like n=1 Tax=Cryptomeria japonica TaxID=3369 RepID=UPI0027DA46EA|nr:aspartyl protease 25-like [Cryptomeria japonica]
MSPEFPAIPAPVAQVSNSSHPSRPRYGDKSKVEELISSETLTVGSQPVEDFVFGCASSYVLLLPSFPWLLCFHGISRAGEGAISVQGMQFTPLLSNARYPSFYYVGLNGISVGGEPVSIPEGTFTFDNSTGRGTIIDSGTVITRLVEPAYNAMRDSFRRQLSNLTRASPTNFFDTCYNKPSGDSILVI